LFRQLDNKITKSVQRNKATYLTLYNSVFKHPAQHANKLFFKNYTEIIIDYAKELNHKEVSGITTGSQIVKSCNGIVTCSMKALVQNRPHIHV